MTTTGSGGMGTRNPGFKYPEFSGEMGLDMLNIRFSSFFKPNFANYLMIFFQKINIEETFPMSY